MFSQSLENTLNQAFSDARKKRQEFITIEHLLLSLLENEEACLALTACGAGISRLRAGLGIYIDETTPCIPLSIERDIQPTLSFQRVLQRAIYQVQTLGGLEVTGLHVLSAIFGEQDSQAVYFLNQENVTRIDIVNYISQMIIDPQEETEGFSSHDYTDQTELQHQEPAVDDNVIETYTTNLNEKAMAGQLNPVIGREYELQRCIQVLCRRAKNNPMFVGEAGVGKTALAEGLAQMIVDQNVPEVLSFCTVYSLDLGMLLAGTKYRGDFEKRFKNVLNALTKQSGAIVFIDEIHNIVGAGSATGGTMDASNLIKPLLSSGDLRCMGATTYEEFRTFIAKDHALLRRFQKIDVEEPSEAQTVTILQGLKKKFEQFHNLTYTDKALRCAVKLAARYMPDRQLPDKAIDVIDEAGASQRLKPFHKRCRILDEDHMESIVADMVRVPIKQISSTDKDVLSSLASNLKSVVFGQDEAINELSDAIVLSRSGLQKVDAPVGSFLLAGPTGVGKTEVTKQLAATLGVDLIRFDMSEYMESHTVSRLIGAPPGYVGHDQAGLLTEAVIKNPHAVLLLDEIEKAHPDLFNILLQVMDYGMLTDNNGRKADFRHIIIIMTTNAGAAMLERNTIGFAEQDKHEDSLAAIKTVFTPEFRNRLDAVVAFHHLGKRSIARVFDKNIAELNLKLKEKNVLLRISEQAKLWMLEKGYNKEMGARPMERLITTELKKPLAEKLLFGDLEQGAHQVFVGLNKGRLTLSIKKTDLTLSNKSQETLEES